MSDDLVKRARLAQFDTGAALYGDLSDRIEELETTLTEQIEWVKRLADDLIAAEGREARLKDKLAKSLAFLKFLDGNYRHAFGDTARAKIRELHAELKEQGDD